MPEPPASVLLLRLSALGDVVHTLPALAHLRRALPGAKLGWVVEERCAALLAGHPHLDRLHVVPRRAVAAAARVFRFGQAARLLGAIRAEVRAEQYALACDFQGNAKSAIVGWLCGAGERLGFAPPDCKEGSHLVTTRRLPVLPPTLNRIEKYLTMARAVVGDPGGGVERMAAPVVPVDGAARARAQAWWRAAGPGPRVLLAPGASARMPEKRWPAAAYGALATRLREALGGVVAVAYGLGERALADAVAAAAAVPVAVPPGPPPLADLVALLATSDLVVGNDSAPTHIAAQLGRPTVALFGPTDPALFTPWGPRVAVVRAAGPCPACDRGAARGDDTHACLSALDPATVAAAADRVWALAERKS